MGHRRHPQRREIPLEESLLKKRQAEIQGSVRESSADFLGCVMVLFFTPVLWVADLFLLTQYWNWFAVPLGAPAATMWHSAGILVLRMTYGYTVRGYADAWEWCTKPADKNASTPSCGIRKSQLPRIRLQLIISIILRLICFVAASIIHARIVG